MKTCIYCGNEVDDNNEVCPSCGGELNTKVDEDAVKIGEISDVPDEPMQRTVYDEPKTKKSKAWLVILIIVLLVIACGAVLYAIYNAALKNPAELIEKANEKLKAIQSYSMKMSISDKDGNVSSTETFCVVENDKINTYSKSTENGVDAETVIIRDKQTNTLVVAAGGDCVKIDLTNLLDNDKKPDADKIIADIKEYLAGYVDVDKFIKTDRIVQKTQELIDYLLSNDAFYEVYNYSYPKNIKAILSFYTDRQVTMNFSVSLNELLNKVYSNYRDILGNDIVTSLDELCKDAANGIYVDITLTADLSGEAEISLSEYEKDGDELKNSASGTAKIYDINQTKINYSEELSKMLESPEEMTFEELRASVMFMLMMSGIGDMGMQSGMTPEDAELYANDTISANECSDGMIVVVYDSANFVEHQFVVEDGYARYLESTDPLYDTYTDMIQAGYDDKGDVMVTFYSGKQTGEDIPEKSSYTTMAKDIVKTYIDEYGDITDGTYIVIYDENFTDYQYIVVNKEVSYLSRNDEKYDLWYTGGDADNFWCCLDGETKNNEVWYVFVCDEKCTLAFNDVVDTYNALMESGMDIDDGSLFVYEKGTQKYVYEYSEGAMEILRPSFVEKRLSGMKKVDTEKISGTSENVTVYSK